MLNFQTKLFHYFKNEIIKEVMSILKKMKYLK